MRFSLIVPTRNEERDIADTLEVLVAIDYTDKEIIIVDDSTDSTPHIVQNYGDHGIRLIHPGGGGRCEARNKGIIEATGEVVCILNADVRPPTDYLKRLLVHYQQGADYVLVGSHVANQEELFARYVGAVADASYVDPTRVEWTEGFSCRRDVALKAGLFPSGYPVPISAGEDGYFGTALRDLGARKVVDQSLVVEHIAPASLSEYWYTRKGRGAGSAEVHRFIDKWSFTRMIIWNMLKILRTGLYILTIFPLIRICWWAAGYSERGRRDVLPFMYAWTIEQIAFHTGEWGSTFRIRTEEKKEKRIAPRRR